MKVIFFHRKPRPNVNFSVENLFVSIRNAFSSAVRWEVKQLSYYSEGFFKRLYLCIEAMRGQKGINHITGDINFIAIFLRKKYTVLTILDVGFMNHPNRWARLLLRWFWIILPVKRSAVVTTISGSTKQELLKYVKTDPDRIKVIYVPIASGFSAAPKTFNKSQPTILQVGTKPNKNATRLVQALQGISCRLEIIGEVNDSLAKELEKAGITYASSKNLSPEAIVAKYRDADIIAFVSTYEGFGMPIVEANATGRVVVTSNLLSMPEVAGNAAHLVDPFDVLSIRNGILKVIEDDVYREQLIINGFENRKRFEATRIAEQFTEIYQSLDDKKK